MNARANSTGSHRHAVWALATVAVLAAALAGCGSERSVQAYCAAFYGDGQKLRKQWISAGNDQSDPFASMAAVFSAPQDLATFFGRLHRVAPDDMELRPATDELSGALSAPAGPAPGRAAASRGTRSSAGRTGRRR